jgi:hypothetical protein
VNTSNPKLVVAYLSEKGRDYPVVLSPIQDSV